MGTEADTCRTLITPRLQAAGWEDEPHSITEQRSFTDGRILVLRRPMGQAHLPGQRYGQGKPGLNLGTELDALLPAIRDFAFKGEL